MSIVFLLILFISTTLFPLTSTITKDTSPFGKFSKINFPLVGLG